MRSCGSSTSNGSLPAFPLPPPGRPLSIAQTVPAPRAADRSVSAPSHKLLDGCERTNYLLPTVPCNNHEESQGNLGETILPASSLFEYTDFSRDDANDSYAHPAIQSIFADPVVATHNTSSFQGIPIPQVSPKPGNPAGRQIVGKYSPSSMPPTSLVDTPSNAEPSQPKRKNTKSVRWSEAVPPDAKKQSVRSGVWSVAGDGVDTDIHGQGVARAI